MLSYKPEDGLVMKIGAYDVIRVLGKGGMSEVYEAENPRLGSRHALKVYAYRNDDPDVRRRFDVEGRLLAKLGHPRIVKVTDIGETDEGRPYFAMDLVLAPDGSPKSLADLSDGEADEETVGRWYDDIRDALAYIHGKGVVHRDLKLQNVLIGPDGHAVLTDFGISRVFDPEDGRRAVVDTVQTLIGIRDGKKTVMGSVGYMAPEVEMGAAATERSDWYALGVIVYRLLTGTWCDARTDVAAMLETYDPVWRRIIPKLLHANPEGRACLSYAEEKAADAERRLARLEEKCAREKTRGHRARHVARALVGVALALAAGLGAGFWFVRADVRALRAKMQWYETRPQPIPFDLLFQIPAAAKGEEQTNEKGDVVMPSRADFAVARDDAFVLTRPVLSGLQLGTLTVEKAAEQLEHLRDALDDDAEDSPFDAVEFAGEPYLQNGDNQPLRMLLGGAVERLGKIAEQ